MAPEVTLRPAVASDHPALLGVWRRAVEATHDFLVPADVDHYETALRERYLGAVELTVAELDGRPCGFAGVDGDRLEMLFVDPVEHGRGVGSLLLAHLADRVRALDVNEQNPGALGFYLHRGFAVVSRSATDADGRPFPLLHLRREP